MTGNMSCQSAARRSRHRDYIRHTFYADVYVERACSGTPEHLGSRHFIQAGVVLNLGRALQAMAHVGSRQYQGVLPPDHCVDGCGESCGPAPLRQYRRLCRYPGSAPSVRQKKRLSVSRSDFVQYLLSAFCGSGEKLRVGPAVELLCHTQMRLQRQEAGVSRSDWLRKHSLDISVSSPAEQPCHLPAWRP